MWNFNIHSTYNILQHIVSVIVLCLTLDRHREVHWCVTSGICGQTRVFPFIQELGVSQQELSTLVPDADTRITVGGNGLVLSLPHNLGSGIPWSLTGQVQLLVNDHRLLNKLGAIYTGWDWKKNNNTNNSIQATRDIPLNSQEKTYISSKYLS